MRVRVLSQYVTASRTNALELGYSGARKHVALQIVMLATEVFVNDGTVAPRERLLEMLAERSQHMRKLHDALRFGDDSLGIPGAHNRAEELDHLLYDEGCLLTDAELCSRVIVVPQTAVRQGLHNALLYFWEQVRHPQPVRVRASLPSVQIEEIIHSAQSPTFPTGASYHVSAMRRNSSQLAFVMDSMHYDISDALHNVGEFFVEAAEGAQDSASTAVLLALIVNLVIILLTYGA